MKTRAIFLACILTGCGGGSGGGTMPSPGATATPSAGRMLQVTATVALPRGFNLPASAQGLIVGPDGSFWFSPANGTGGIENLTRSGQSTMYTVTANLAVSGFTVGPDSHVWFTVSGNGSTNSYLGTIGSTGISMYQVPDNTIPQGLNATGISPPVSGTDGNLYFIATGRDHVTQWLVKSTTSGTITETAVAPPQGTIWGPTALLDVQSTLWFEQQTNTGAQLASMSYNGSGTLNPYQAPPDPPPPNTTTTEASINAVAQGGDGRLYYALYVASNYSTGYLAAYPPNSTSPPVYYQMPDPAQNYQGSTGPCSPAVAAKDGTIWVAECVDGPNGSGIGEVAHFVDGSFTTYEIPNAEAMDGAFVSTNDGMLWLQIVRADQTEALIGFSSSNP